MDGESSDPSDFDEIFLEEYFPDSDDESPVQKNLPALHQQSPSDNESLSDNESRSDNESQGTRGSSVSIEVRVYPEEAAKALEANIRSIKQAGDFYSEGQMTLPMPNITIEGVGQLSFPIPPDQAQRLIEKSSKAPFGRGEKTVMDLNVRNTWQIQPEAVSIVSRHWNTTIKDVLRKVGHLPLPPLFSFPFFSFSFFFSHLFPFSSHRSMRTWACSILASKRSSISC